MSRIKKKVAGLLNRIQFIDLSKAVAQPISSRKDWLRKYLDRSLTSRKFSTYKPFRKATPTIYGVQRDLDPSPTVNRKDIEIHITRACKGVDVDMNVEAALTLFDLVRPQNYAAYDDIVPRSLPLGLQRKAAIGIEHYVVKDETLIFQFPYPRRERLDANIMDLMMSMIFHTYAVGDFEGAEIEIADLSCAELSGRDRRDKIQPQREPRIVRLSPSNLISMDDLTPHVQSVHDLLIEIGDEGSPT